MHKFRVNGYIVWAFIVPYFPLANFAFGQSGSISLSSGTASGGAVSLNLTLSSPAGSEPVALQWTFTYPPANIVSISAVPGAGIASAGKSLSCVAPGAGVYTCLVWGLNTNTILNGSVAIVNLIMAAGAAATSIGVTNTMGASSSGNAIPLSGTGGIVGGGGHPHLDFAEGLAVCCNLFWQQDGTNVPRVWYTGGADRGTLHSYKYLSGPQPGWRVVTVGDLNGDGHRHVGPN